MFLTCHLHIQSELNYSCLNVKELYAQKSYFIIRLNIPKGMVDLYLEHIKNIQAVA